MTVRIVLADDQALIRAGFRMIIDAEPDLEVVAEAANGDDAVRAARDHSADVVLMDIRMPGSDGLKATRAISDDEGLAGVKVLILTTFEQDENVYQALEAGASGFLGKGVDPDDLLTAVRVVAAGEALLSPTATRALIDRFRTARTPQATPEAPGRLAELTAREREIVALVAQGLSNDEIAAELVISAFTVKTHVNRSIVKLGLRDRAQLVVLAYRTGLAH